MFIQQQLPYFSAAQSVSTPALSAAPTSPSLFLSASELRTSGASTPDQTPLLYDQAATRVATILAWLMSMQIWATLAHYPRFDYIRYLAGMEQVQELLHRHIGSALDGAISDQRIASRVLLLRGPANCGLQRAVENYCETCRHSIALLVYKAHTNVEAESSSLFWNQVYELAQLKRQCIVLVHRLSSRSPLAAAIANSIHSAWFRMTENDIGVTHNIWTIFIETNDAEILGAWCSANIASASFVTPSRASNLLACQSAIGEMLYRDHVAESVIAEVTAQCAPSLERVLSTAKPTGLNRTEVVCVDGRDAVDRFTIALFAARKARPGSGRFEEIDFTTAATQCVRIVDAAPSLFLPLYEELMPSHTYLPARETLVRHPRRTEDDADMLAGLAAAMTE